MRTLLRSTACHQTVSKQVRGTSIRLCSAPALHACGRAHYSAKFVSPHWLNLVQELREAGLLVEDELQWRLPTVQDLADLRFLDAVFHEGVCIENDIQAVQALACSASFNVRVKRLAVTSIRNTLAAW